MESGAVSHRFFHAPGALLMGLNLIQSSLEKQIKEVRYGTRK